MAMVVDSPPGMMRAWHCASSEGVRTSRQVNSGVEGVVSWVAARRRRAVCSPTPP